MAGYNKSFETAEPNRWRLMMNALLKLFRRETRHYTRRTPPNLTRRAMLCARVHIDARQAVRSLAAERGISISEYVARMLNDHLSQVARARGKTSFKGTRP